MSDSPCVLLGGAVAWELAAFVMALQAKWLEAGHVRSCRVLRLRPMKQITLDCHAFATVINTMH